MPKTNPNPLILQAPGYRLQNMGGHDWVMRSPGGVAYHIDMAAPYCECKSREQPYCKHIQFVAGIYRVMVDIEEPEGLPVMMKRLEHYADKD